MPLLPGIPGQTRVAAPDTSQTPDLLDMSLEDPMLIEIDSVYVASGFEQKVSEAPASVVIITADDNFEVNALAAERAGLKMSSRLLDIATIVKER